MNQSERLLYARGLFTICINEWENTELTGKIYHCFAREGLAFFATQEIFLFMEQVFAEVGYPQASTQSRSFSKLRPPQRDAPIAKKEGLLMEPEQVTTQKGTKATFVVRVQFRQNASWQGSLIWGEKNRTLQFRSALELLKLIDSALCEEDALKDSP